MNDVLVLIIMVACICRVDQRGVRSDAELKELMYELMEQEEVGCGRGGRGCVGGRGGERSVEGCWNGFGGACR